MARDKKTIDAKGTRGRVEVVPLAEVLRRATDVETPASIQRVLRERRKTEPYAASVAETGKAGRK